MSQFSNPIARAPDDADAYSRAVVAALESQDPVVVLRRMSNELHGLIDTRRIDVLRQPEAPDKWSVAAVVQHLADSDLVWAYRLRMVLAHNQPRLAGYDQDAWAAKLRYDDVHPHQALMDFDTMREFNLRLISGLNARDLMRVSLHEERGHESLEHMLAMYAGHDVVHLRQIRRILDLFGD